MSDILNEINADLRQQQLHAFWRDNANWIIGGALLAIIMTGVLTFWRGYETRRDQAETAALVSVIDQNDPAKILAEAETSDKTHAAIARFAAAGLHVKKGERDAAVEIYREIQNTSRLDRNWKDLAAVFEAAQTLDTAAPESLHALLDAPSQKKSVWRFSAMELDALVYARENKMDQAKDLLGRVASDDAAPVDLRSRAATLRDIYASQ